MGDRMIVLDEGAAIMIAPPETVFARPATRQTARFLNAYNILEGVGGPNGFDHQGVRLPTQAAATGAAAYAIRFDAAAITEPDDPAAALPVEFITSEFTGSGVTYFLRGPAGVVEAVRHLSTADPVNYASGQRLALAWAAEDALLFDHAGDLMAEAA